MEYLIGCRADVTILSSGPPCSAKRIARADTRCAILLGEECTRVATGKLEPGENLQHLLIRSTKKGNINDVGVCLDAGADSKFKDERGFTAVEWAKKYDFSRIEELVKGAGTTVSIVRAESN